jgi:Flp pilus assembly pilin Flp
MLKTIKRFLAEEDGISTVEIVVIIAVLVGIALLFRKSITEYVKAVIANFIDTAPKPADIETQAPVPSGN